MLLAAGEGRRVGAGRNKVLLPLHGEPVFAWSVRQALRVPGVTHVVLVVRPEDRAEVDRGLQLVGADHPGAKVWLVPGGDTRHGSEWNALGVVAEAVDAGEVDVVAIHDTARPLAGEELYRSVIRTALEHGGALPVRTQRSLLPHDPATALDTDLVAVQTPQAFRAGPLLEAYRRADRDGFTGTDTASCVERYTPLAIHCVENRSANVKITFPEDVALVERLLAGG